jgi:hypothetical protein
MRPLFAGLLLLLILAPSGRAASPNDRLTFTVPVSVAHLHNDLTMVRARCTVFSGGNWRGGDKIIGQAASQPYATQAEGGVRAFMGDLDVPVFLGVKGISRAKSYACALELYNAATQEWSDADTISQDYPLDRAAMAVTSIGGPLR